MTGSRATGAAPRPRSCPVCRSAMIAQDPEDGAALFRCDDCGCEVDLRSRTGEPPR